jgi:hypothetical protein
VGHPIVRRRAPALSGAAFALHRLTGAALARHSSPASSKLHAGAGDEVTFDTRGAHTMLVKLVADMVKTQTVTGGEVDMILGSVDYSKLNVAICPNIKPTIAHYHPGFDEIYFVLGGWIHIKT